MRIYFLIIIAIAAYFSAMYFATTITIEGLEYTYHIGDKIKFTAKVKGFGDAVPSYYVNLQSESNPGVGIGGVGEIDSVNTSYLNFPIPFEKTIDYSHQTNISEDRPGVYIMKFGAMGHTVEKKISLLP